MSFFSPVGRLACGIVLAFLFAHVTFADDACSSCGDDTPYFPEAQSILAANGFPSDSFTVLFTWEERGFTQNETMIHGYRVSPRSDGAPLDVYVDSDGELLTRAELDALGIREKNWSLPPIEQATEIPAAVSKHIAGRPRVYAPSYALESAAEVTLPELDMEVVEFEDELATESESKGPTRIGIFRDLDPEIVVTGDTASIGRWQTLNDGWLWTTSILSPDAIGQRIHFREMVVPAGGSVIVYNAHTPTEAYGPIGTVGAESDVWSPTCFSDTVVVECFVPTLEHVDAVRLSIDRISHQYIDFANISWAKAAGSCNNDVTCSPDWATTATGVGGLGTIGSNGSLFCTGTLLADADPDTSIPFILTANHCVGTQSKASSVEVYWMYQTPTCNAVAPSPSTVPRTIGGATLLATTDVNSGTDFVLLRLNNQPPEGIAYVGWSSQAQSLSTSTVCIHHPRGDYKRISFGVVTDVPEATRTFCPASRFYQSSWTSGVTEPGSSGSPLFNASTQRIIGQLYGGPSSCSPTATKLDYYGRFDVSFALMSQYLAPPDAIPPTVAMTSSSANPTNTSPIIVTVAFSEDVFGFDVSDIQTNNASVVNLSGTGADYTFHLVPSSQGSVGATIPIGVVQDLGGNSNSNSEVLSRIFDSVRPSADISSATLDPIHDPRFTVTVAFGEPVVGFAAEDLLLTNADVVTVTGGSSTYEVELLARGEGAVLAMLTDNAVTDAALNVNTASSVFSRQYTVLSFDASLTGVVFDAVSSSRLSSAAVRVYSEVLGVEEITATDVNGVFSFPQLPDGPFLITAYAHGHISKSIGVSLKKSVDNIANFFLDTETSSSRIFGNVTDATSSAGVVSARVDVKIAGELVDTTYTAADGSYELVGISAKAKTNVTLEFSAPGFFDDTRDIALNDNGSGEISLALTRQTTGAGSVQGAVLDASSNQPLPGAQVILSGPLSIAVTVDGNGGFSLGGLSDGQYTLTASAAGYTQQSVTLQLGQETVDFHLQQGLAAPFVTDVNGDAAIDAVDVQLVINAVLGVEIEGSGDVNRDGALSSVDVQLEINAALEST